MPNSIEYYKYKYYLTCKHLKQQYINNVSEQQNDTSRKSTPQNFIFNRVNNTPHMNLSIEVKIHLMKLNVYSAESTEN